MGKIRRAWIEIIHKDKNITTELTPYLQNFEVIDNLEGQLDSMKITLLNKGNKFMQKNWSFSKGEILEFKVKTLNWENENEGEKEAGIGLFYVDEREYSKESAVIKGVSAPLESLDVTNSKTWQSISLKRLGEEFSNKYGLKFMYLCSRDITLKNLTQEKETDFSYLNKIAQEEGVKLKLTCNSLVLFEESEFSKKDKVRTIDLLRVIDFNLLDKSSDIYDSVEVKYFDIVSFSEKKVVLTAEELKGEKGGSTKKTLKITKKPASMDMKTYALKKLEQLNKRQQEIEITTLGDRNIYAGSVFEIINSGEYNGNYLVTQVTKTLPGFIIKIKGYKI